MLLQTHYKTQLNFTFQGLDAVKHSLQRLNDFVQRLFELADADVAFDTAGVVVPKLEKCHRDFAAALGDDLNISVAFAALFELVREVNALCDAKQVNGKEANMVLDLLKRLNHVLGLLSFERPLETIPTELQEALEKRIQARQAKDWALSDQLRDFIHSQGYVIEDTQHGVRLKKGEV